MFLRFQEVTVEGLCYYHKPPVVSDAALNSSAEVLQVTPFAVIAITAKVSASSLPAVSMPFQISTAKIARGNEELKQSGQTALHAVAARTFSGAQACITACVDAISGRAAMTRTRATSSPAASLAKAAAAPSGWP